LVDSLFDDVSGTGVSVGVRKAHVRSAVLFRQPAGPELFLANLADEIPETDVSRRIYAGLAQVDLSFLSDAYYDCGGVAYPPRQMLAVLLLGYAEGVTSSRGLQSRCCFDIRYRYVSGGLKPDDRTIGRFQRRLGSKLDELFKATVRAAGKGKDGKPRRPRLVAVDGTKMRSAAGKSRLSKAEREQLGVEVPSSDPDARMLKSSKGFILGYNAQAAIDVDTGLVLATDVFQAPNDHGLLGPVLAKVEETVGAVPEGVVADAGYDSHASHKACEDAECTSFIAPQDSTALFWTAVEEDKIVCPMGHEPCEALDSTWEGKPWVKFSVPRATCKRCPFFASCCPSGKPRSVELPQGCDPVLRVLGAHRARSPGGRIAGVQRMGSVECLFGRLKANRRMDRFKLRGLGAVRLEFALMVLAQNMILLGRPLSRTFWWISALIREISRAQGLKISPPGRTDAAHCAAHA
jgi:transposase